MKKGVVLFPVTRDNRWSYIALAASVQNSRPTSFDVFWLNLLHSDVENLLKTVDQLLENYGRVILAYSFMTPRWIEVKREWELITARYKNCGRVIIVAGGPHPSGAVKEVLQAGCLGVFSGEGEESFAHVTEQLLEGFFSEIPSGFYRIVGDKIYGSKAPLAKGWEESFPFPTRPPIVGPIEITRGCPFKCSYCATPILKGMIPRHRNLDVIIEAVRLMVKLNKKDIRFITPNALSYGSVTGKEPNPEKLDTLLSSIRGVLPPEGRIFFGSFPSEVRPDFVTSDIAKLLKAYCANRQIVVGAQSGSNRMLQLMRRGHTVEDVLKACDLLVQHGFVPAVDMIFGLPYEDEEDLLASVGLMEKLSSMGAKIHAHYFLPLPGSRWAGLKPTPISPSLRRYIEKLIAKGKLFGQWMHQEHIVNSHYSLATPG